MEDYDVIGFDADNCIVNYHESIWNKFEIEYNLRVMHEQLNYPKEILEFDIEKDQELCLNGCVYDIENGLLLKLAEHDCLIVKAFRGFKELS